MGWDSLLGFEHGIVQAPLGPDISGPELVAAVANAGGIGLLRAPDQDRPETIRDLIAETRSLTTRPFGVGIILAFPHEKLLDIVLDEKVAVLQVFWGDFQKELVEKAHQAGVKVIHQVGSVEEARNAAIAGVDAVIAQGVEAGGHVRGTEAAVTRFSGRVPNRTTTGQIEDMVMYAGEGARLLKDILSAASVIKEMVEGAQRIIESFQALRE